MNQIDSHLIGITYARWRPRLHAWLRKAFPKAGRALIEDAVNDAFVVALERPARFAQAYRQGRGLALLRRVAWRQLRAYFRRKSSQCELAGEEHIAHANAPAALSPAALLSSYQEVTRTFTLVDEAADQFGGKQAPALRAALHMRLAGSTDTEAAKAHNVPREYVNRAKRWIGMHLCAPDR